MCTTPCFLVHNYTLEDNNCNGKNRKALVWLGVLPALGVRTMLTSHMEFSEWLSLKLPEALMAD